MPTQKSSPRSRKSAIDYDAMSKDVVTAFFREFILLVNPALHDAIDWFMLPVFLEQELINILKGKYRVRGKRKQTDKLVQLRMLDGTEQLIYVHCEFQHRPEENYGKRVFTYFALSFLRYDPDHFTAISFFTGAPPDPEQLEYKRNAFGTKLSYQFVSLVAARQTEQELIDSDNPMALVVLAALYAWRSEGKPRQRIEYKKKLFDLVGAKDFDEEKMTKLLIFVFDFVHLPKPLEHEFLRESSEMIFPTIDTAMKVSAGVKEMADIFYQRAYGVDPKEERKAIKREREAAAQREREAAQPEREAAQREREAIIRKLYREAGMIPAQIATLLGYETAYVEGIISAEPAKASKNDGE